MYRAILAQRAYGEHQRQPVLRHQLWHSLQQRRDGLLGHGHQRGHQRVPSHEVGRARVFVHQQQGAAQL